MQRAKTYPNLPHLAILPGTNWSTKKLADGSATTYVYVGHGRGAIRLNTTSREAFMASYIEANARKVPLPGGTLAALIHQFEDSPEFTTQIAPRTQADYRKQFKLIEREFGDLPLAKVPAARGMFKEWRDEISKRSLRQADAAWIALQRVCSWALDRRKITANPCEKGGRLYHGTRADKIWTPEQEAIFLRGASQPLCLAFMLAVWTGQRQGDLLALKGFNYDGSHIRLRQSKGGVPVTIPVSAPLKVMLDAMQRQKDQHIVLNSDGEPWTTNGFSSSWRKACKRLGISGVTFHDVRGTFVTRAFIARATEAEIATITGHSLAAVRAIRTSTISTATRC
jgi:integrase